MFRFFLFFFLAAGFSFLLTPLVRAFAVRTNITDPPGERKIHKEPVPLLGGVSVFFSFNLAVILGIILNHGNLGEMIVARWQTLFICQVIILGLGFFDDLKRLQPGVKFVFQILVGVMAFVFGFGIQNIANQFHDGVINLGLLSLPVTILWVVMITNALNLIDGLDGLASGTAFIASMTIFAISYFNHNEGIAFVAFILAGSILGFLRYNFHPAKIFLGDSGSLLLGFLLAIFSVQGSSKGPTLLAMMAPILALGLPIMDTLLTMIRRFLKSIHIIDYETKNGFTRILLLRNLSIFTADKDHLHHRLMKRGFSHRKAVVILYGVCISLSVLAFFSFALKSINIIPLMGAVLIAFFIGIRSLNYQEFKILENGLLIPLLNYPIVNRRFFLAFYDLAAVSLSVYLSLILLSNGFNEPTRLQFMRAIPLFLMTKIILFYVSGLYKLSIGQAGLEEAIKIVGATVLSSLSTFLISTLIFGPHGFGGPEFFILDFYLLLTLVGGFRFVFRILNTYYRKGLSNQGKKVLLYGAGNRGSSLLKEIRHNGSYTVFPVGFIDDDPQKRGRNLHGCPIMGTLEDLDELSERNGISEIIISTQKIGRDKVKKLLEFCRNKGIVLRQFEFRFYEFP
jgi:UDP-GlcNAc:undecaprenyl-phosphate GlcNAc-1-phosphate transferase